MIVNIIRAIALINQINLNNSLYYFAPFRICWRIVSPILSGVIVGRQGGNVSPWNFYGGGGHFPTVKISETSKIKKERNKSIAFYLYTSKILFFFEEPTNVIHTKPPVKVDDFKLLLLITQLVRITKSTIITMYLQ